ncbi:hypothetical protein O0555_21665 [Brevibacillus laterosporus]|uniref:hypothetical protein n=1 Tax=Brevibacillus laterosporus TaxID=1465 RepID=UPI0018CF520E|nr:hypothetical protein [Brevibacillus laterosporus]MBG9797123.1 hypothetical protein [Brevibacillus laterosporus]MCR8939913.1 hypothetical protein [Brevibacillus laterosporus]MCZ0842553.1 hypothetical protein [Brevibacillus laterosporus]MCZ0847563.1 hypothetical protein [Brevibacillus laterosporus]MED1909575.1 hypothetical protein [Brevibacillus laterosporus]
MLGAIGNQQVFDACRTFYTDLKKNDVGKAVTMIGPNKVGLGEDGNTFVGVLERVDKDGASRVRCFGNVEAPYSGKATLGSTVVVDGKGAVKAVTTEVNGRGFVSFISSTTDKVQVEL